LKPTTKARNAAKENPKVSQKVYPKYKKKMNEVAVNQKEPVRVRLLPKIQELIIIMTKNKHFDPTPCPHSHPNPRAFVWPIVNVDYNFACAS